MSADQFRLDGKTALVTGAATGIGAAVAEALARAGARVMLTDIAESAGQACAGRLRDAGHAAQFLPQDVVDEARWDQVVAAVEGAFGGLDVLVNNAGIETASLIAQCRVADFERVMAVNVTGVFLGLRAATRAMQPCGSTGRGGAIVNISSIAGMIGTAGHIAYHASKGAVRLMTKAAAVELAQLQTGIRVNSVHPSIVQTAMGKAFIDGFVTLGLAADSATAEAGFIAAHPMGHLGTPEDVAAAVLYLASNASKWVTGTELTVDGGYTAA
jgi:3alpha(or 20beta)-hydroxysteroid dehydrogenase